MLVVGRFAGHHMVGVIETFAHESRQVPAAQPVDHPATLFAGLDHSGEPQLGQMLTDCGARGPARFGEGGDVGVGVLSSTADAAASDPRASGTPRWPPRDVPHRGDRWIRLASGSAGDGGTLSVTVLPLVLRFMGLT